MKFRCERDVLVEALNTVSRAVASRGNPLPVLSGVRMEVAGDRLRLAGSDLDLTIQTQTTVAGAADGVAVLPGLVREIVRALEPGAVDVESSADDAVISSGRSQFTVRILPAEEYPKLPEPAPDAVTLAAADFAEALRQVVPAASHDIDRPVLTGVLVAAEGSGLRLVATDSYRLAVRDLPGTSVLREGQKVLVPSRALGELGRLLAGAEEVTLHLAEKEATFDVGTVDDLPAIRLTTRLIEGEFPNYRQLIPASYPNRLVVAKAPLLDALRRVKLLALEATPVRLALRPDGLELTAIAQEVGQAREEVDAKYEGGELVVAFNPEFLIAGLEAVEGDEVALETLDALKPATIRANEGSTYLYLLMPVRVS